MSHAKTTDARSQWSRELALGARMRHMQSCKFIIAGARTNNTAPNHHKATIIPSETRVIPIMIAPCDGKILRISYCAQVVPAGGTLMMTPTKSLIADTDVALATALSAEQTNDTTVDFALVTTAGYLDFIEGQLIYLSIAASADAITTRSEGAIVTVEWMPTEK